MSHAGPIAAIAHLRAAPRATPTSALTRRLWLLTALASGLLVGLALTLPFPARPLEPDLARLLHGMVLIKGLIGLAVAGLVWWRLGRPVADGLAAGYAGAVAISAAALGWLWGLHLIALGSIAFYAGLAALVLVARRDPLLGPKRD